MVRCYNVVIFILFNLGANMRLKYPAMRFGGQILYSRTSTEVEMAAIELRRILEANKSEAGQAVVGFDIEWKPTFRKGNSVFLNSAS